MSAERIINTHRLLHNLVRFYTPNSEDSGRWRSERTSQQPSQVAPDATTTHMPVAPLLHTGTAGLEEQKKNQSSR